MPERLVGVEKQGAKVLANVFMLRLAPPLGRTRRSSRRRWGGGQHEVRPERGIRASERQDARQARWPTDPIRRSAWRAGGPDDRRRSGRRSSLLGAYSLNRRTVICGHGAA